MTEDMPNHPGWGTKRAEQRDQSRKLRVGLAIAAAAAAPIAIPLIADIYDGLAGADRKEVAPTWLVAGCWLVALGILVAGCVALFRGSDEFERRSLVDAAAVTGVVLTLVLPPAIFISGLVGLFSGEAAILAWIAALLAGFAAYLIRRTKGGR